MTAHSFYASGSWTCRKFHKPSNITISSWNGIFSVGMYCRFICYVDNVKFSGRKQCFIRAFIAVTEDVCRHQRNNKNDPNDPKWGEDQISTHNEANIKHVFVFNNPLTVFTICLFFLVLSLWLFEPEARCHFMDSTSKQMTSAEVQTCDRVKLYFHSKEQTNT